MILITGATGQFGKAAINFLLKKGIAPADITALVRDAGKAADLQQLGIALRVGDYNNYDSLLKAFAGIDKLLFVSASDIAQRLPQHKNVVKAAKEAGVGHVFYTSFERKDETPASPIAMIAAAHLETEQGLSTGIPAYTIMRDNVYTEWIPIFLGEQVLTTGVYLPAGEGKVGFAARSEMAEAAANLLTTAGHENKTYYFSSADAVSFGEIAGMLSVITGKEVNYYSPAPAEYEATLAKAGVPAGYIAAFSGFAQAFAQGELQPEKADLEAILGRKPASVQAFLQHFYGEK